MSAANRKRRHKRRIGVVPGSLIAHSDGAYTPAVKTLFEYDREVCSECKIPGPIDIAAIKDPAKVSWLNIDGVQDSKTLEEIGTAFNIHPLVLEDIQSPDKRPKIETYDDYLFIVLKMLRWSARDDELSSEQLSIVLGRGYVLSFQENTGDVFDFVRDRLRNNKGRIRKCGADYLAYSLVDAIVDNYFEVFDVLERRYEELEDSIVYESNDDAMSRMHRLRNQFVVLRRAIWPLREMIHEVLEDEHDLIEEATNTFYRDIYDHILEISDTLESFRDSLKALLDIYNSQQSKQLNATMKLLTIISTIFIPPTFIVGLYGMNFHVMPELSWRWGYPLVWLVILAIVGGMIVYFRRKKWF